MMDDFNEWWNNLSEEQKQHIKELVIIRLKQIPDNLSLSIGGKSKYVKKGI